MRVAAWPAVLAALVCAGCGLRPSLGPATWSLAPGSLPPRPDTTILHVLVTETACAGGEPPGARLRPPRVTYDAMSVVVTFQVERKRGAQTCLANPATRKEVRLDQPLGNRRLLDGGTNPPSERAGPG